jgi:cell wall-associated NlpC family hydrolase
LYQKHNIKLDNHHDTFDWYNNGNGIIYPYYDAYFAEWGFYEIREEELEEGDIVIMSFGGTANHLGVYIGDYNILHHAVNQPPAILSMARLKSYIHRFLRHNDKGKN